MDDEFWESLSNSSDSKFKVGEVAILHPPHPLAKSYWGAETTILEVYWVVDAEDAMYGVRSGWCYITDIPAPPVTDLPEDRHSRTMWSEYDLKKKCDGGGSFEELISEICEKRNNDIDVL